MLFRLVSQRDSAGIPKYKSDVRNINKRTQHVRLPCQKMKGAWLGESDDSDLELFDLK